MRPFQLSVKQYREKREREHFAEWGYLDEEDKIKIDRKVERYASDRQKWKAGGKNKKFNPFTSDPGCKSCKKKKQRSDSDVKSQEVIEDTKTTTEEEN